MNITDLFGEAINGIKEYTNKLSEKYGIKFTYRIDIHERESGCLVIMRLGAGELAFATELTESSFGIDVDVIRSALDDMARRISRAMS